MNKIRDGLRVLFVGSELAPLIKTGGLADVSHALPAALRKLGVDVQVLAPGYRAILDALADPRKLAEISFGHFPAAALIAGKLADGLPVLALDCPALYLREGGPYQQTNGHDWPDNAQRFGLLCQTAALLGSASSPISWRAQVVHSNDWPGGLAPAYLHLMADAQAASLMTIHNLAFQGNFPAQPLHALGLPQSCYQVDGVEFYGNLSFLKAGIYYAGHITTVSPAYAGEIQRETWGFGMHNLLATRAHQLTGILNGIDTAVWNPATDVHLARNYDAASLEKKAANKLALQKKTGLAIGADTFLIGMVSRFAYQKGFDLFLQIAREALKLPLQLVVLGSGDPGVADGFAQLAQGYPGRVSLTRAHDEALAHQIEAGADAFLMPSRYEPCGLNQMYSQRYGTPPIVHATGGLADTVEDCTPQTLDSATGFVFRRFAAEELLAAIRRALAAYQQRDLWRRLQENGMARDFSWGISAQKYSTLYHQLVSRRQAAKTSPAP